MEPRLEWKSNEYSPDTHNKEYGINKITRRKKHKLMRNTDSTNNLRPGPGAPIGLESTL